MLSLVLLIAEPHAEHEGEGNKPPPCHQSSQHYLTSWSAWHLARCLQQPFPHPSHPGHAMGPPHCTLRRTRSQMPPLGTRVMPVIRSRGPRWCSGSRENSNLWTRRASASTPSSKANLQCTGRCCGSPHSPTQAAPPLCWSSVRCPPYAEAKGGGLV